MSNKNTRKEELNFLSDLSIKYKDRYPMFNEDKFKSKSLHPIFERLDDVGDCDCGLSFKKFTVGIDYELFFKKSIADNRVLNISEDDVKSKKVLFIIRKNLPEIEVKNNKVLIKDNCMVIKIKIITRVDMGDRFVPDLWVNQIAPRHSYFILPQSWSIIYCEDISKKLSLDENLDIINKYMSVYNNYVYDTTNYPSYKIYKDSENNICGKELSF